MLWTDATFITTADLARVDSEISEVATAEDITLTGESGLLQGAVEEAAMELQKLVIAFGGYMGSGDVSPNHLAAVMNTGVGSVVRHKALLEQVVVSGDTATTGNHVKQWAVFWALQIFYRDAFNRTVKDRYEGKMRFYRSELQRRVTPAIYGLGLPLVIRPLSAPAATFVRDSGSWDASNLSKENGAGTLTTALTASVTYADMSAANLYLDPDNVRNAESHPSALASITMETGKVLKVDISSLNPPDGSQHPSRRILMVISPLQATHWNLYVGASGGRQYLQNATPIPIDTETYTLVGDPLTSGPIRGFGQYPERVLALTPMRQRA